MPGRLARATFSAVSFPIVRAIALPPIYPQSYFGLGWITTDRLGALVPVNCACLSMSVQRARMGLDEILAEGVGFEPTREREPPGGFQDRCLKPLGHPSKPSTSCVA